MVIDYIFNSIYLYFFRQDLLDQLSLAIDIARENPHINKTWGILPLEFIMLAGKDLSLDFIWHFIEKSVDIGQIGRYN